MTRINTISPEELTDQWLMAEYREITHVYPLVESAQSKWTEEIIDAKIPASYTFNKGHVTFFYNKLGYIEKRYFEIKNELIKRGYNLTPKDDRVLNFRKTINNRYYNDWTPQGSDHEVNVERLLLRLSQKPNWYRKNGAKINDEEYSQQLSKFI